MPIAATFEIEYLQYLDADGKLVRDDLPEFAQRRQATRRAVQADAVRARVRRQGDRAAAHRQARHLRIVPRPRSRARRDRRVDAGRRRVRADVPRIRRAVLPRREAARSAALLGRRRARQRFLRVPRTISPGACRSRRSACTPPAPRSRSRSARSRASRSPSSATAVRRRPISTARSTSAGAMHAAAGRGASSTTSGRSRCRARRRPARRRSRRKASPRGLECMQVDGNDLIAVRAALRSRDQARAPRPRRQRASRPSPIACPTTRPPTTRAAIAPTPKSRPPGTREPMQAPAHVPDVAQGCGREKEEDAWKADCATRVDVEVNAYLETQVAAGRGDVRLHLCRSAGGSRRAAQVRDRQRARIGRDALTPWPQITLIEAVTQALAYEMKHDDSVVVLGEDVGVNGGVFRATAGLQQKFGAERVHRHAARRDHDRRPHRRPRRAGHEAGRRSAVRRLHLSDDGAHRLPRGAHAHRTRGRLTLPGGVPRAVGRRHPRAGASFRSERASLHQHAGPARRAAVVAAAAPTACCSPRSAIRIR